MVQRIVESFDWKRAAGIAGQSIKIAVAVGTIAAIVVPGPQGILAKVLNLLKVAGSAVTVIESAKKIFFENPAAQEIIKHEKGERIRYSAGPDRIQVMRPLQFKAKQV